MTYSQGNFNGAPSQEPKRPPVQEALKFDENKLAEGVGTLLDSLEGGLPGAALAAVEKYGNYSSFRQMLNKIPNAGRSAIGKYGDWASGAKMKGAYEESLADALDAQLVQLLAGGVDLDDVATRMKAVAIPSYILDSIVEEAATSPQAISGGVSDMIRAAFSTKQ